MWRSFFLLAIVSGAAMGQEPSPSKPLKLDDYTTRALQNALRAPSAQDKKQHFWLSPGPNGALTPAPLLEARTPQRTTCAIPLRTLRVHVDIDPRIYNSKRFDDSLDKMATLKAMPVCRE